MNQVIPPNNGVLYNQERNTQLWCCGEVICEHVLSYKRLRSYCVQEHWSKPRLDLFSFHAHGRQVCLGVLLLSRMRAKKLGAVGREGVQRVSDISLDVLDIFAVVTVAGGMAPSSWKALEWSCLLSHSGTEGGAHTDPGLADLKECVLNVFHDCVISFFSTSSLGIFFPHWFNRTIINTFPQLKMEPLCAPQHQGQSYLKKKKFKPGGGGTRL